MREWIDELSSYLETQEEPNGDFSALAEEVHQAVLETDDLLMASNDLQNAYASILGKIEHVDR